MQVTDGDRVNHKHICVIRKVEQMTFDNTYWWKVIANLDNGSEFVFAKDCTKQEASDMVIVLRKAVDHMGLKFVRGDSDAHINLHNVTQLYVDEEGSSHAVFLEDMNAMSWLFAYGSQQECSEIVASLAGLMLGNPMGEERV